MTVSAMNPMPYLGFPVAAATGVIFGAMFYNQFHNVWLKYSARPMTRAKGRTLFITGTLINTAVAITLSKLIDMPTSLTSACLRGLFCGAGLVGASVVHNYFYTNVHKYLMALDSLYYTMSCGLMAMVLQLFGSPQLTASHLNFSSFFKYA